VNNAQFGARFFYTYTTCTKRPFLTESLYLHQKSRDNLLSPLFQHTAVTHFAKRRRKLSFPLTLPRVTVYFVTFSRFALYPVGYIAVRATDVAARRANSPYAETPPKRKKHLIPCQSVPTSLTKAGIPASGNISRADPAEPWECCSLPPPCSLSCKAISRGKIAFFKNVAHRKGCFAKVPASHALSHGALAAGSGRTAFSLPPTTSRSGSDIATTFSKKYFLS
jgi:hypothetical protein